MLSSLSWLPGIVLAGLALLSPVAPLQVNTILDDCTCKMSVETATDNASNPSPGVFVPGCGQCLGVFTEMIGVTKGVCTGEHCTTKGECKGKMRVQITSVSSTCCASIAGGWKPSWGSGWIVAGGSHTKEFDQATVKCGGEPTKIEWSLTWRNAAGAETTQNLISTIVCSNCDGPPPQ